MRPSSNRFRFGDTARLLWVCLTNRYSVYVQFRDRKEAVAWQLDAALMDASPTSELEILASCEDARI